MSRQRIQEIKQAVDRWAEANGHHVVDQAHREIATAIYGAIEHRYSGPVARKGLLVDVDQHGDYCNARIVDWDGAEETLYPVDPVTDEPVEEAVAHYALPLPRPEDVPEI